MDRLFFETVFVDFTGKVTYAIPLSSELCLSPLASERKEEGETLPVVQQVHSKSYDFFHLLVLHKSSF